MLTSAELFCIDIDHLEELRICLAPAARTTTHSTASTIPIFLFAPKRFWWTFRLWRTNENNAHGRGIILHRH